MQIHGLSRVVLTFWIISIDVENRCINHFPTSEQYGEDRVLRGESDLKHLSSIAGGEIEAEEGWRDGERGRRRGVRNGEGRGKRRETGRGIIKGRKGRER